MNPLTDEQILTAMKGVFALVLPEAALVLTACVIYLAGTFAGIGRRGVALLALAGLAAATALAWTQPALRPLSSVAVLVPDGLAVYTRWLALLVGALLMLIAWSSINDAQSADYQASQLIAIAGLSLAGGANDLITLFLALEFISIPTYIMLYLPRGDRGAQEATLKYFLLSVLSSAIMLLGFSYLYGLTGTTNLSAIHAALTRPEVDVPPAAAVTALMLVVAGLGYKITAVPFHFYAPDVYQGSAYAPLGALAVLPKAAGFVALVRVLGLTGGGETAYLAQMPILLLILALITMTAGNVLALGQNNLKRLLAYSGVAHGGYMLIGLATSAQELLIEQAQGGTVRNPANGIVAVCFYLVAYAAMTLGTVAVLSYLSKRGQQTETIDDLAGLRQHHPGSALVLTLFFLSLIGLPLTAGFVGKYLLLFGAVATPNPPLAEGVVQSAWETRLFPLLALAGAINAAIGAIYYLRAIGAMFLRDALVPLETKSAGPARIAVLVCAVLTLTLGVVPTPLLNAIRLAAPASAK